MGTLADSGDRFANLVGAGGLGGHGLVEAGKAGGETAHVGGDLRELVGHLMNLIDGSLDFLLEAIHLGHAPRYALVNPRDDGLLPCSQMHLARDQAIPPKSGQLLLEEAASQHRLI